MALPAPPSDIPAEAFSVFKAFVADTLGYQRTAYYVGWVVVGGTAIGTVVSVASFVLALVSFYRPRGGNVPAGKLMTSWLCYNSVLILHSGCPSSRGGEEGGPAVPF